ncbi:hypothetical protein CP10139811_1288B, partial [Chlamydia ibidis]
LQCLWHPACPQQC